MLFCKKKILMYDKYLVVYVLKTMQIFMKKIICFSRNHSEKTNTP